MSPYACTACFARADVVNGALVRSCACAVPVAASMSATVSQHGGIAPQRTLAERVLAALGLARG